MAEKQGGFTKYFPADKDYFPEGSDAWECLNAGCEITVNENGKIVDVWDPKTKEFFSSAADAAFGVSAGTRETSYEMPPEKKAIEDMTKEELEVEIKELGTDIAGEGKAVLTESEAVKVKDGRMTELMRAFDKASRPPKKKYRRRGYYTPRPYRYTPETYYRLARDTFVLPPEITESYIFKTYGWARGGGIPRD